MESYDDYNIRTSPHPLLMARVMAVNPENGILPAVETSCREDAGAAFVLESKGTINSNLSHTHTLVHICFLFI